MIPREAGRGRSFTGAGQYYLHDKGAATSERVAFSHTENVPTNDPHKAIKWMAWTAINAKDLKRESGGATWGECEKPVYTFSLAWHPEQKPENAEMINAGKQALIGLGLQEHEAVMVRHTDRDHPHMHLIVNLVHPETGKASRLSYSWLKLSDWAEEYERQRGKIYCDQRIENNAKRAEGESVKYREPELDLKSRITEIYQQSDSARTFQAALEAEGFRLAQGKRLVLLDNEGKIHSLYRQIGGVKSRDIKARLADLELPDVDEARDRIEEASSQSQAGTKAESETTQRVNDNAKPQAAAEPEPVRFDREAQDRDWQESIIDAAIKADQAKRTQNEPRKDYWAESPIRLNALQERHHAELGAFYTNSSQDRMSLDAQLDEAYGENKRRLETEISHLEGVLANSGRLRRWWLTLTHQLPREPEVELDNMRRTLKNTQCREDEARQGLQARVERQKRAIEVRHEQERRQLQEYVTPPVPLETTPCAKESLGPTFEQ